MAVTSPIQQTFIGGEISPRLQGNTETPRYAASLDVCTNWMVTPQGTLEKRPGMLHVGAAHGQHGRLFRFAVQGEEDVVVELGAGNNGLRLWRAGGRVNDTDRANLFTDPTFLTGWQVWERIGATNLVPGYGASLPTSGSGVRQSLGISATAAQHTLTLDYVRSDDAATTGSIIVRVGSSRGGSDVITLTTPVDVHGAGTLNIPFTPGNAIIWVDIESAGDASLEITRLSLSNTTPATMADIILNSPYTTTQLSGVHAAMAGAEQAMVFTHFNVHPHTLKLVNGTWTMEESELKEAPSSWEDGNWPRSCAIMDSRLWMGGTPINPGRAWASTVGDYNDFTPPGGNAVTPEHPLDFPLATPGTIQFIHASKDVMLGTENAMIIGTSEGGFITTADYAFPQQSGWGTASVRPLNVGKEILMLSHDQRKVRVLWDAGSDTYGYEAAEASFWGEHLVAERVVDFCYVADPFYQLAMVTASGRLIMCTFNREQELDAFWTVETEGTVLSVIDGEQSLWMRVERNGNYFVERIPFGAQLGVYLDHGRLEFIKSDDDGKFIDGMLYLANQTVSVVVGDTVHPDVTVSAAGELRLESWARGYAGIGLGYQAKATTLRPEGTVRGGSSQVAKMRWSRVYTRLSNSALPTVNGQRTDERFPENPMGNAPPRVTGDYGTSVHDYQDDGKLQLEQDLPLRTEVTSLFGILRSSKL